MRNFTIEKVLRNIRTFEKSLGNYWEIIEKVLGNHETFEKFSRNLLEPATVICFVSVVPEVLEVSGIVAEIKENDKAEYLVSVICRASQPKSL